MQDLAERGDYDEDVSGYWERQSDLRLVFYTVAFGAGEFFLQRHAAPGKTLLTVTLAALGGLTYGLIMRWSSLRRERRRVADELDRVVEGDPDIVASGPADATHRLPCGLFINPRLTIGGVLYACPRALLFQPHYPKNRDRKPVREAPSPLQMGPPASLTLNTGVIRPNLALRLTTRRPSPVVIVGWQEGRAAFLVPRIQRTIARLQHLVDQMRLDEANERDRDG